uniref:Methylated-DNA--[protein]-cysteine S-methyltransferase n=1 Tax=Archaeoglobus fulgidus TaxID=2234 RepID=A0A7C3RCT0_ARCFL
MFSVRWGELYFNVVLDGGEAVKSYFSTFPSFDFSDSEHAEQLLRYFSGEKVEFRIPYRLDASEFAERVLEEVSKIPYGKIRTYSEIARTLKTSPRAVGQVVKRNPLPIIIPCHRVVGKKGIGGYTALNTASQKIDGKSLKEKLLRLEGIF